MPGRRAARIQAVWEADRQAPTPAQRQRAKLCSWKGIEEQGWQQSIAAAAKVFADDFGKGMTAAGQLPALVSQFVLVFVFFFFICGLLAAARVCLRRLGLSTTGDSQQQTMAENRGLQLFGGVIAFCLLCNLLLIIPTVIELISGLDGHGAYVLHRLSIALLRVGTLALSLFGAVSVVMQRNGLQNLIRRYRWLAALCREVPVIDRLSLYLVAMVLALYVVVAQLFASINYDTALYHLPAVRHLLEYGPELGLANLHFCLGFYNLPLFGQVAIQSLVPSRLVLSPSLNIVFLAAFLLTVSSHLLSHESPQSLTSPLMARGDAKEAIRILAFLFMALVLGAGSFDLLLESLVSYNADFALSMMTLAVVFAVYFCREVQLRDQALALSLLLPLIKLSGVLGLLLIALLEGFRRFFVAGTLWLPDPDRFSLAAGRTPVPGWSIHIPVIVAYATMALTYYLLSGYLIFPEFVTGPISAHAVPQATTKMIKGALVTFYARANDNGEVARLAYDQQWKLSQWLPDLLRTQRGLLMAFWVAAAVTMAVIMAFLWIVNRNRVNGNGRPPLNLLCLALAMPVMASLALFVLPPNPRFFPWIGSLIGFEFADLLLFYPSIALLAVTTLMALITWRLQRPMLRSAGEVPSAEMRLRREDIHGWKARSRSGASMAEDVIIRIPRDDKCWAIERPCTPYLWFLKGKEPKILPPQRRILPPQP